MDDQRLKNQTGASLLSTIKTWTKTDFEQLNKNYEGKISTLSHNSIPLHLEEQMQE